MIIKDIYLDLNLKTEIKKEMSQRQFSIVRHADLKQIQEDPINRDLQIIDETVDEDTIAIDIAEDDEELRGSTTV